MVTVSQWVPYRHGKQYCGYRLAAPHTAHGVVDGSANSEPTTPTSENSVAANDFSQFRGLHNIDIISLARNLLELKPLIRIVHQSTFFSNSEKSCDQTRKMPGVDYGAALGGAPQLTPWKSFDIARRIRRHGNYGSNVSN